LAIAGCVFPAIGFLLAGFTLITGLAGGELSRVILTHFMNQ